MNDPDLLHGGALDWMIQRFPRAPLPWVDLSTGINPWPYPVAPAALDTLSMLPTRHAAALCTDAMAVAWGAPVPAICPVPGTEWVIRWLPRALRAERVLITHPCYGDHAAAWRAAGVRVVETADPVADHRDADVVVICNPNNPDGRIWSSDVLVPLQQRLATAGGWLIVDEAFGELAPRAASMAPFAGSAGLVVLRSFGKFFGLPGLRLGALLAPPALRHTLSGTLGQWGVSSLALQVGAQAYRNTEWATAARHRLTGARVALDAMLADAGIEVVGGTDLFRYVAVADAHRLWQTFAESGIYVRRFPWSNTHLRIGLPADAAASGRLRRALGL